MREGTLRFRWRSGVQAETFQVVAEVVETLLRHRLADLVGCGSATVQTLLRRCPGGFRLLYRRCSDAVQACLGAAQPLPRTRSDAVRNPFRRCSGGDRYCTGAQELFRRCSDAVQACFRCRSAAVRILFRRCPDRVRMPLMCSGAVQRMPRWRSDGVQAFRRCTGRCRIGPCGPPGNGGQCRIVGERVGHTLLACARCRVMRASSRKAGASGHASRRNVHGRQ